MPEKWKNDISHEKHAKRDHKLLNHDFFLPALKQPITLLYILQHKILQGQGNINLEVPCRPRRRPLQIPVLLQLSKLHEKEVVPVPPQHFLPLTLLLQ
ncbi:MAG: hypothetical protein FRX49_00359 [Trebouxia sp. A1-2]|nr:MAG: hypothetical protein FRX49_00359 [Trebouxia sp. A1-2]